MGRLSLSYRSIAAAVVVLTGLAAIALSVFQLWQGITADFSAPVFRPIHLSWVMVLVFLCKPMIKDQHASVWYRCARCVDFIFILAVMWSGWRIARFDYDDIGFLLNGLGLLDQIAGIVIVLALLETTRRVVGSVMMWLVIIFLAYAMWGNFLPESMASKGFSLAEMLRFHVFSLNGVFGIPLGIAAGVVFTFVLFGSFLQVTGAGQFFIDCAFSIAGRYRGGPAKASVLASAALGSISGSAIANTVTTGALTIPMMKKLGYRSEQAAGIEAAASTGGQIMPPVMGAGAFIMSQFTGIPYSEILLVSIAPAILFFASTLLYVHLMACKLGLQGLDKVERLRFLLKSGWHFLVPLCLVTVLLMMNYSPILVGVIGCFAVVATACCRKSSRLHVKQLCEGLREGALLALPISVACAAAGIIVGVVGQTGIGLQFAQGLLALSGGYLWISLALIVLAAAILGMGLPVTAAYIVLSVIAVPVLTDFGLPLLTANMILFWLSQVSNVTPPIALAAFAGAAIAEASPIRSAVQAFKLAQGLFLIPIMMAFSSLLLLPETSAFDFVSALIATSALIIAFAGGVEGYLLGPLCYWQRILLLVSAVCLLIDSLDFRIGGMVLLVAVLAIYRYCQQGMAVSQKT